MDKRVSTALIAVRDTLVALGISLPVVAPLLFVIWWRTPERAPDVDRARQVIDAVGWMLPVVMVTSSLGFWIAGWWFRRHRPVPGWERPEPRRLPAAQAVPLGILLGFGGLVLSGIVGALTLRLLGVEVREDELMNAIAGTGGVVLVGFAFLATVVAPVGEELFFRGHLFRWTSSRCGVLYAYVVTTTIFVLGHGSLRGIPVYLTISLILAWSYERWRTLVVPIAAHATFNAIVLIATVARLSP